MTPSLRFALPCLLLALTAQANTQKPTAKPKLARHPYVQLATEHSICVAWRTAKAIRPVVRYGKSPRELDRTVPPEKIAVRVALDVKGEKNAVRLHSAPDGVHQYEAQLAGLDPDHAYYYAIYDGDTLLAGGDAEHRFHTLPVAGKDRPARFLVIGDSGTGGKEQREVFTAVQKHQAKATRKLDGFLHLGDMAYHTGTDVEFGNKFYAVYTPLLRHTVCWPAMGNHEGGTSRGKTGIGPYYDGYILPTKGEAGGLPSGTEAYYSFDFGNAHFIVLDSHDLSRKPDGAMALWLRSDLERTKAKFVIAYWHHPPYTLGSHDSNTENQLVEMRTHIMPILESGGVDLVLTGHSHIYERSMLIDGAYSTPTTTDGVVLNDGDGDPNGHGAYKKSAGLKPNRGTVAVVAGNGGAASSRKGTMPIMRRIFVEHGAFLLDVDNDSLSGTMLNGSGKIRDRFRIEKKGEVERRVEPHPWDARGPLIGAAATEFSGSMPVTITARPAAPDAKIHFTLDGSEPTLSSPVYTKPIMLTENAFLKTFSTWRGGKRISPVVSMVFSKLPPGAFMRRIRAANDDMEERFNGKIQPKQGVLELGQAGGKEHWVGLRFSQLDLPRGTKIKHAHVQFRCREKNEKPARLAIYVVNGERFRTGARALSKRVQGTPPIYWSAPPWRKVADATEAQRTPDLAVAIQRFVDSPTWKKGDDIAVIIGGTGTRKTVSFDLFPRFAPFLWIEVEKK